MNLLTTAGFQRDCRDNFLLQEKAWRLRRHRVARSSHIFARQTTEWQFGTSPKVSLFCIPMKNKCFVNVSPFTLMWLSSNRFFRRIESPQDKAVRDTAQYLLQKPLHRELLSAVHAELSNMHGYVFKRIIRASHKEIFEMKTITWQEYKPDAEPAEYLTKCMYRNKCISKMFSRTIDVFRGGF